YSYYVWSAILNLVHDIHYMLFWNLPNKVLVITSLGRIRRRGSDEGTEEERNEGWGWGEPHGDDDRDHTEKEENSSVKIKSDIPLIMPKGVEGIRICCSGRLGGAEIKIDYAPAEGRAISETNQIISKARSGATIMLS
ncbi:hypothetical protein ACJX0J_000370, partial (mitochondrion) [Zea mays]